MSEVEKLDGQSKNFQEDKLEMLKEYFPEVFTEDGFVDCEKLKQTLGEHVETDVERYGLTWAGKHNCFKAIQEPTTKTLKPEPDESVDFEDSENIFIEGENLETLKVLQRAYHNKVKMIYIDPPYNTGKDFVYRDKWQMEKEEYEKESGERDADGEKIRAFKQNTKGGRYHSNWLNMMYPRLRLARNLMREDGVIFVSIDDNEVYNLRHVMDEVFGEENFVTMVAWRRSDNQSNIGNIATVKEYILLYCKDAEHLNLKKIDLSDKAKKEYRYSDDKGKFRRDILLHKTRGRHTFDVETPNGKTLTGPWMIDQKTFQELQSENKIYWASGEQETPYGKIYLNESEGQISNDFWGINVGTNQQAARKLTKLFGDRVFDFPKPFSLIQRMLKISGQKGIMMDFFAGSGAAAHAVMKQNAEDGGNRKYIMVQLPEETNEDSEARKAGYENIAEIAKERIRRAGEKIKKDYEDTDEVDLGFKAFKLAETNFKQWVGENIEDKEQIKEQIEIFVDNLKEGAEGQDLLFELMLKRGIDLNAEVEEKDGFYLINGTHAFCLSQEISEDLVDSIIEIDPEVVICLDVGFSGNDELKANTALRLKDKEIEFKVV